MESLIRDLVFKNNDKTIYKLDGNNKIYITKSMTKKNIKLAKSKNMIWPYFLTKSKILVEPIKQSFRLRFFTFGARLIFTKMRLVFIKFLIFYYCYL